MSIQITDINNGATLSGDLLLEIRLPWDIEEEDVSLSVDGNRLGSRNRQPQDDGIWTICYSVSTWRYSNGPHHLSIGDASQIYWEATVNFQNEISEFSCDGIYALGENALVSAKLINPQAWQIEIYTFVSGVVKTLTGYGTEINVHWNGKRDNNTLIPNGSYGVCLRALEKSVSLEDTLIISV